MRKVSNKDARQCVVNQEVFTGSNTFAHRSGGVYTVYSYGLHFPMFVRTQSGKWYFNSDKYSVSTSRQFSQLRPDIYTDIEPIWKKTREMIQLSNGIGA